MGNGSQEKANSNLWDELFKLRDQYREQTKRAPRVIKGNQLPLERNKKAQFEAWHLEEAWRSIREFMLRNFQVMLLS